MLSILFYQMRKLKPKVIQLEKEARIQTRSDFEVPTPSTKYSNVLSVMSSVASDLSSSSEKVEYKTNEIISAKSLYAVSYYSHVNNFHYLP